MRNWTEAVAHAQEAFAQLVKDHKLPSGTEVVVLEGYPSTRILVVAEEKDADAIVIASHDPGLVDYFLGSVAARVVRHAHCSVVVVRSAKQ